MSPPRPWLAAQRGYRLGASRWRYLSAERFPEARQQIELACQLSKSRVLEEPRYLLCKEVLHVPFPAKLERLRPPVLLDYMQVARDQLQNL